MTALFELPTAWIAEPYPTHHSFAYEYNRDDNGFRVEFTADDRSPSNSLSSA